MFVNIPPTLVGIAILKEHVHYSTMLLWTVVRFYQTNDAHHGYEFPWSPLRLMPFVADAEYHDFHHFKNVGNYSSFMTVWDTLLNTNA